MRSEAHDEQRRTLPHPQPVTVSTTQLPLSQAINVLDYDVAEHALSILALAATTSEILR